jgi:hypothetical protein
MQQIFIPLLTLLTAIRRVGVVSPTMQTCMLHIGDTLNWQQSGIILFYNIHEDTYLCSLVPGVAAVSECGGWRAGTFIGVRRVEPDGDLGGNPEGAPLMLGEMIT